MLFRSIEQLWDDSATSAAASTAKTMAAMRRQGVVLNEENKEAIKAEDQRQKAIAGTLAEMEKAVTLFGQSSTTAKLYELALNGASEQEMDRARVLGEMLEQQEALAKFMETEGTDSVLNYTTQAKQWIYELGDFHYQMTQTLLTTTQEAVRQTGDAFASAIVQGTSLLDTLQQVAKNALKNVISMLVQYGIQRMILFSLNLGANKTEAAAEQARGQAAVFTNSFASAAAIPLVGWAIAPQVATANSILAAAGAVTAGARGAAIGGAFHGGTDFVPSEQSYLLARGERVLSPRQNRDQIGRAHV